MRTPPYFIGNILMFQVTSPYYERDFEIVGIFRAIAKFLFASQISNKYKTISLNINGGAGKHFPEFISGKETRNFSNKNLKTFVTLAVFCRRLYSHRKATRAHGIFTASVLF